MCLDLIHHVLRGNSVPVIRLAFPKTKCYYISSYSDSLQAGQCGNRIPVGGEPFRTCSDQPWGSPNLLYDGYNVQRPKRGVNHPSTSSADVKQSRTIGVLPFWAFMVSSRVSFTFFLLHTSELCQLVSQQHKVTSKKRGIFGNTTVQTCNFSILKKILNEEI